jgi:hypothetical protein
MQYNNNSILIYILANLTPQRPITKLARVKEWNKTHTNKIQEQVNLYHTNNDDHDDDDDYNNSNSININESYYWEARKIKYIHLHWIQLLF